MEICIRPVCDLDLESMLNMYSYYVLETSYSFEYDVPSIDVFRERFSSGSKNFPWICCEVNGVIAGYAYASEVFKKAAYRWDADSTIYLDRNFHQKGIGSALYECLMKLLKLQGYHNIYAIITASNERSISFHKQHNFTDIGIFYKTGYKYGKWHDVLWMERTLIPAMLNPPDPIPFPALNNDAVARVLSSSIER
jgi:phosphinothricin acetyltransferase